MIIYGPYFFYRAQEKNFFFFFLAELVYIFAPASSI